MNKFHWIIYWIFILLALMCGCDDTSKREIFDVPKERALKERFKIQSYGKFNAGSGPNVREILIITDTLTHKSYLGITDMSLQELNAKEAVESPMLPEM